MTALARATSALRFGVMIYQLPFHHPIRLAEDVAMLDHLSKGRIEFGAGTGVTTHEFLRWNVPFDRRRDISEEAIDIILQAWTQDSVTYDGEFFKFDEVLTTPKPFSSRIRRSGSAAIARPALSTPPRRTSMSPRTLTLTRL